MSDSARLQAVTTLIVLACGGLSAAVQDGGAIASGLGTGRLLPGIAALVGLIGVVLGGLLLAGAARRIRKPARRRLAAVAIAAGVLSAAVGGLHAANAAGGIGTGNGLAGAIVAVVLGLLGIILGRLARARTKAEPVVQA